MPIPRLKREGDSNEELSSRAGLTSAVRSIGIACVDAATWKRPSPRHAPRRWHFERERRGAWRGEGDRKSTRLNSSHQIISYAVFCLKKKKHERHYDES